MRRFFSPRVTIALGIAGVTVLSVSALDTAAAFTDTANAASSFSRPRNCGRRRRRPQWLRRRHDFGAHLGVRLYVIHDGSKKKYRLRFKQDDGALRNTQDIDPGTAAAGTRSTSVLSAMHKLVRIRVGTTTPRSTPWIRWWGSPRTGGVTGSNQPTIWNLDCKDQISSIWVASSEGMFAARAAEPTSTTVTPAPTTTTSSASSTPTATTGPSTTTTTTTGASTTATATATASTPKATTTTGPSTTTTTTTSTPSSTTTTTATRSW